MLFELLFLLLVLMSVIAILGALGMLASRRRRIAIRTIATLGIAWAIYLGIVAAVAACMPQRVVEMNRDLCFDEMCFAAVGLRVQPQLGTVDRAVKAKGEFYVVTIRVSNHARGDRAERELGIRARLLSAGIYYDVSAAGQKAYEAEFGSTPEITGRLARGQSLRSVQIFDLPRDSPMPGLVIDHGFTPGYFVIGESSLFHRPTVISLDGP